MQSRVFTGQMLAFLFVLRLSAWAGAPFLVGVDANYTLAMEKAGHTWSLNGQPSDLFAILHQSGFNRIRLRIWTGDSSLNEACEIARRAQAQGLSPVPVLFLSEDWADYVKQPLPAIWKDLSFDDRVKAVRAYTAGIAARLEKEGFQADLFEIGNEIDFGICGEFEEKWNRRLNVSTMKSTVWPRMARLIQAAEEGVRTVRPNAKFILHLTQWWNPDFCAAFFQTMSKTGVTVDYAGLSFYPTSGLSEQNSLDAFRAQTARLAEAIHRPLLICEFGYPSEPKFGGQFSTWNHPATGFALNQEGQAAWSRAFLQCARDTDYIRGVFYWSPEWYASNLWSAFALFDSAGSPKKALREFSSP